MKKGKKVKIVIFDYLKFLKFCDKKLLLKSQKTKDRARKNI